MIAGVSQVVIPVRDQDEAKKFWVDQIGFEVVKDEVFGDERWIEVRPPGTAVLIALVPRAPDDPAPRARDEHPDSPVFFESDDIVETYRELSRRGVAFPTPPVQMHFGWWAMFADQDGTRYALGQSS